MRLERARKYHEVAELMLAEGSEYASVATGNSVLAGIAAADAVCCALAGQIAAEPGRSQRGWGHLSPVMEIERAS